MVVARRLTQEVVQESDRIDDVFAQACLTVEIRLQNAELQDGGFLDDNTELVVVLAIALTRRWSGLAGLVIQIGLESNLALLSGEVRMVPVEV